MQHIKLFSLLLLGNSLYRSGFNLLVGILKFYCYLIAVSSNKILKKFSENTVRNPSIAVYMPENQMRIFLLCSVSRKPVGTYYQHLDFLIQGN
jgi:hypothetical protein